MSKVSRWIGVGLFAAASSAMAQTTLYSPNGGSSSPILTCPYECKAGPTVQGSATYQEITTLQVANHGRITRSASILIFDGQSNPVATIGLNLTPQDLDELNVCRSLEAAAITPPSAGLLQVVLTDTAGITEPSAVFGWIKILNGRFFANVSEPFSGRVVGNGRTECQSAPVPGTTDPAYALARAASAPTIPGVLVEATADPSPVADLVPVSSGSCSQVRIQNLGNLTAPASTARVTYIGFASHTLVTPSLAPAAFVDLMFPNPPFACTDQTCYMRFEVDILNVVTESNEANNARDDSC